MQIQFVKQNDQIKVSDLVNVRGSYPLESNQLERVSQRYQSELLEIENRVFILSFGLDGEPLAYVQLILKNADNDPELADGNRIAHVHDLRVRFDFQGRGFGREMMNYIEDEARFRGFKVLTLGVDNWNERAIKFYELLGYSKFKEAEGRTEDEVCFLMRKQLG